MRTGKLAQLPHVRQPFEDELLSSWLARTAALYGMTWDEFCYEYNLNEVRDHGNNIETLRQLTTVTGIRFDQLYWLDLKSRCYEQPMNWFVGNQGKGIAAPDYCVSCLTEDTADGRDQYIRWTWAVAGVGCCQKHGTVLSAGCKKCLAEGIAYGLSRERCVLCCSACGHPIAFQGRSTDYDGRQLWPHLGHERFVLKALQKDISKPNPPLAVLEDVAFLFYYADIKTFRRHTKSNTSSGSREALTMLSANVQSAGLLQDDADLYPMAILSAHFRTTLLLQALNILFPACCSTLIKYNNVKLDFPTLFFSMLDETGREEMVRRGDDWPLRYRQNVEALMRMPVTRSWGGKVIGRTPWSISNDRLNANRGIIPSYRNL
jgi:hypothetical protein